jgi:putative SOS response-associated peptidase YedK
MCGRYTLTASPETIQQTFDLPSTPPVQPRYNIAPTQPMLIVKGNGLTRNFDFVSWGLVPSWAKDLSGASQLINARSETLEEKPSFKNAFKYRRCIVPADGFYEWAKSGDKLPKYIHFADRRVFGLAGLWETWTSPHGDAVLTSTIITTEPNELIKPFHHRMAVILRPEDYETWLDPKAPPEVLKALLNIYPADEMRYFDVSTKVNSANIESSDLIEPYVPPKQQTLF